MAIVKLGQTGFSQVKQVLEALRGVGRSCSPGGLAVDSPIWPCPLQGAHGNAWMGGGMNNSSLPQPPRHRTSCWADGNHPSCPPCHPDLLTFIRLGEKYKAIVIIWPAHNDQSPLCSRAGPVRAWNGSGANTAHILFNILS